MLARSDQWYLLTALRSAVVIGDGVFTCLLCPRSFRIKKFQSKNPDDIDEELSLNSKLFLRTEH